MLARRRLARSGEVGHVVRAQPAKGSTRAKPDTPGWAAGRTDRFAKFKKKTEIRICTRKNETESCLLLLLFFVVVLLAGWHGLTF